MKGMPLPFDFQGKGVLDLDLILQKNKSFLTNNFNSTDFSPYFLERSCISETSNSNSFGEPKSVLDSARFPSGPTSSSTPSSSHGGGSGVASAFGCCGASTDTTNPSPKWHQQQDSTTATSCSNILATAREESLNAVVSDNVGGGGGGERLAMEDWESVLTDVSRAGQEQSVLRWIMGEDSNMGAPSNKVIELGGGGNNNALEFDFNYSSGGFGVVDQENFGLSGVNLTPNVPILDRSSPLSSNLIPNLGFDSCSLETKPPELNSQLLMNQYQAQRNQNASLVLPPSYTAQHNDESLFLPPQSKRHNPGFGIMDSALDSQISKGSYSFNPQSNHLHDMPHQIQFLPQFEAGPVKFEQKPKMEEDVGQCNQQQSIVDQLYKAAELVQVGNLALAQEILARLNHQLSSPIGKPFQRAAFYCKEALQKLLLSSNNYGVTIPSMVNSLPFGPVFKIGAYKSFSEISPVVQFANFTCNQVILEALEGFDRVHVIDFDIGYGGQWASLMQELALRNGGGLTSLKVTVLPSPTSSLDQLELGLTRESLIQFASETKIAFDFDVLGFDSLNHGSWASHFRSSEEAIVVNLPVGVLANSQELSVPSILRFLKQLSPRIIVSVDRGCDRSDLTFASHMIHALQSYSNLLESLDAVDANADSLQKIERFLLQPGIERIVTNRFRNQVKAQHWRALFLSYGFSPVNLSNFTESQAECITKRTPVRGFTVEKRQCSLVLCWQRKELISASAWRC